jgi:hypothetical protein
MTKTNSVNANSNGVISYNNSTGVFTGTALTQHNVLVAGASNIISSIAPGTSGNVLTSNGTDWTSAAAVDLHTANFIVGSGSSANYSTIASALTAASSGNTIFIQPGTYTENLTLKAGVNLTAFICDGTVDEVSTNTASNVTVIGKMTATNATFGSSTSASISGIQFKTNGDFLLSVSGTNTLNLTFTNCYFNCHDNTGISINQSGSKINFYNCNGQLGTTGIGYFTVIAGNLQIYGGKYFNTGNSTTASTVDNANLIITECLVFQPPISITGTSTFQASYTIFNGTLTLNATNTQTVYLCNLNTSSNSAITIGTGATATVSNCVINSGNTNAITGVGTLIHGGNTFVSSSTINTTTQTSLPLIVKEGGLGVGTLTSHGVLIGQGTSAVAATAAGSAGQVLQSGGSGADPAYSTATYPSTAGTSGNVLVSDGTNIISQTYLNIATQPAFSAILGTSDTAVTGDGTAFKLGSGNALTIKFDQGSNFTTAGTFTAPVTGKYYLGYGISYQTSTSVSTSAQVRIVTTNATYGLSDINPVNANSSGGRCGLTGGGVFLMAANDTAIFQVVGSGGTKNAGIGGTSSFERTFVCGYLIA